MNASPEPQAPVSSLPAFPRAQIVVRRWFTTIVLSRRTRFSLLIILTLIEAFWIMTYVLPLDPNWYHDLYPAGRALLEGRDPYAVGNFFNPPWLLALLAPLALLPPDLGKFVLALLNFFSFAYVLRRFKATRLAFAVFLLSLPVLFTLAEVDIDGLVLLGILLPPPLGLFVVLLKPQFGLAVALFWLVEAWRTGRWTLVVKTFAPLIAVSLISLAIFGLWFNRASHLVSASWNTSLFPYSIPIGLALLVHALESRDIRFALPATLCLSPYVGFPSWSVALFSVIHKDRVLLAASLGLWIVAGLALRAR